VNRENTKKKRSTQFATRDIWSGVLNANSYNWINERYDTIYAETFQNKLAFPVDSICVVRKYDGTKHSKAGGLYRKFQQFAT